MPTRIILARHGETDWNLERRWQGHSDRPLKETGGDQVEEIAEQLAGEPISAVYSSDLVRAHETARIVADRLGLDVVAVPGLRQDVPAPGGEIRPGDEAGGGASDPVHRSGKGGARSRRGRLGRCCR